MSTDYSVSSDQTSMETTNTTTYVAFDADVNNSTILKSTTASSSLSPSTITESSTATYTSQSTDSESSSSSILATTSINSSGYYTPTSGSAGQDFSSDIFSSTYSSRSTSIYTSSNNSENNTEGGGPGTTVTVVLLLLLLLVAAVAIFLYVRYRRIRWRKSNEHKEMSTPDNGFITSHHMTNEVELKAEERASPLCLSTQAPPTSADSKENPNSDHPNEALPTVHQPTEDPPSYNETTKAPPIYERTTETPPSFRQKRKTKPSSCHSVYVPPPVNEDFMDCIKRHQENLVLYQKEFDSLPDGSIRSSSVARAQENIVKNRYVNVLPYDENRVALPKKSELDSDYINASFIDGAVKKRAYICTQGPLTSTLPDFWSMIWDNNSNRIVMLTNLEESIRGMNTVKTSKCTQYWPSTVGDQKSYGDIEVSFLNESVERDWTVRTLAAKKKEGDTVRTVQQYHYTTWPDQDVPHTSTAVLKFHRLALQSADNENSPGPVVIHCSAGVGRTGTLIAIDILAEKWKDTQPRCDVFKCVQSLRQQRMSMVQSVRQYMFIHHSLIQEFRIGVSVEQTPQEMLEHRHTADELQEQFKILEVTSNISILHCSVSKSKPKKNRSTTILPSNSLIRFLKPVREDDNVYINAVPVNGFLESNAFVVTQMPLNHTINDFWRLVNDNNCHAIVMLNSTFMDDERYWPLNDEVMETKSFNIKKTGSGSGMSRDGLLATDLEIQYKGSFKKNEDSSSDDESSCDDSIGRRSGNHDLKGFDPADANQSSAGDLVHGRPVLHLRVTDWPETQKFPSDPLILLDLYDQVLQLRARRPKRPILIQCLYGADRSGLFCALVNVLDRLAEQGIVGIFDAVKLIKERRQQFVPDFEHYDYLHKLINIYLNKSKGNKTGEDISRDGQAARHEMEPRERELTHSEKRSSAAEGVTLSRNGSGKQGLTKEGEVQKEKGMTLDEFGSVGMTQNENTTQNQENIAQKAEEKGITQDAKDPQEKGMTQDTKDPQEKGMTQDTKDPKNPEIIKESKEPEVNRITDAAEEQKEKGNTSNVEESQKKNTI